MRPSRDQETTACPGNGAGSAARRERLGTSTIIDISAIQKNPTCVVPTHASGSMSSPTAAACMFPRVMHIGAGSKLCSLVLASRPLYPRWMQNENLEFLYPALSDADRKIAQEILDRYLELAWEIWEESQKKNSPD